MKFWEKFWKLVSRKDLVFGILLFAVVIGMAVFETYNKVRVEFSDTAVDIRTSKYSMNIPYEMVDSIELVELPDAGTVIDGADDMAARTGRWENETWGEYYVGMTVEGRKNKAVVSFAAEGTCSPLAFGAVIEYPTLSRAATGKNAYLSAMQDRLPSRAN